MSVELRLTVPNDLRELPRVNDLATGILERIGVAGDVVYSAQLAIEEVLSNVIRHGYRDGGRHEIDLVLRADRQGVELEVADDGRAFDPVAAPEPELDLPLSERRIGGLGIHLLRAFTRGIRYKRTEDRNVLWLQI